MVVPGQTLTRQVVDVGARGLHAARRLTDCICQGSGLKISRVRLHGVIQERPFELAATARTCLWAIDGRELLCDFARTCASHAIRFHPVRTSDAVQAFLSGDSTAALPAFERLPIPSVVDADWYTAPRDLAFTIAASLRRLDAIRGALAAADVAVYCAVAAHVALFHLAAVERWGVVVKDFVANCAIGMAYLACLFTAGFLSQNYREGWQRKAAALNAELEAAAWQKAFDEKVTNPDAERNWRLAHLR